MLRFDDRNTVKLMAMSGGVTTLRPVVAQGKQGEQGEQGPTGPPGNGDVTRLYDSGSGYDSRPVDAVFVEYVGASEPTDAQAGDTWIDTGS